MQITSMFHYSECIYYPEIVVQVYNIVYSMNSGAFLVPYLVFVVICAAPLFLLEMTMGQYTQQGGVTCWRKLCPLAEGTVHCSGLYCSRAWKIIPYTVCTTENCRNISLQQKSNTWTNIALLVICNKWSFALVQTIMESTSHKSFFIVVHLSPAHPLSVLHNRRSVGSLCPLHAHHITATPASTNHKSSPSPQPLPFKGSYSQLSHVIKKGCKHTSLHLLI